MRVIAGTAKGKMLETVDENSVRPTPDRVKEAVFSALQFEIGGETFLDLFAGSGQMGIEALSRGAAGAYFVDCKPAAINVIKNNLVKTGLFDKAKVVNMDSILFASKNQVMFDIVFLDPPYRTGVLQQSLGMVTDFVKPTGMVICEHPADEILPERIAENFRVKKNYKYGKIAVSIYRKDEGDRSNEDSGMSG